ncbi:MAG TPA: class I SAM-dependent methyltransferase [Acidimicrobiales bacterium]|nr:class I SAM-dependent methyltransferase [Acidimicrobiales bacterium]
MSLRQEDTGGSSDDELGELSDRGRPGTVDPIDLVLQSPPHIHPLAPGGVWRTQRDCYEFIGSNVSAGSATLETGAGISTLLFAAWRCEHLCVVPDQAQVDGLLDHGAELRIDMSTVHFDVGPSEAVLPALKPTVTLDLVFIDGCHGFPMPVIDWFYAGRLLRKGGVVVFDDLQLPHVSHFLDWYLERDPRWDRMVRTPKWAAFRRLSEGPLAELHTSQPFVTGASDAPAYRRLARSIRRRLTK